MKSQYLFVGEARSPLAKQKGWTWADGHLAARQLFDALLSIGLDPAEQQFLNLFEGDENTQLKTIRQHVGTVVGMGKKVCSRLRQEGIPHLALIHPAARGRIRRKELYSAHVRSVLETAWPECLPRRSTQ